MRFRKPFHAQSPALTRSGRSDSPDYPVATTRLSLAKLLLEMSLHAAALEILQQLENEDDEDPEVWYLSGWAWWLLGESRGEGPRTGDDESREECWSEGKLCLENYLRVRRSLPSPCRSECSDSAWIHLPVGRDGTFGVRPGAASARPRADGEARRRWDCCEYGAPGGW